MPPQSLCERRRLLTAPQLNARPLGIAHGMRLLVRCRFTTTTLVLLFTACFVSSCPAKRTGPLAPMADSVASRVARLSCLNPVSCMGHVADTVLYYLSGAQGRVQVVGREWGVPLERLQQTTDSIVASLTAQHGEPTQCPTRLRRTLAWTSSEGKRVLTWIPGEAERIRLLTILPDQPCDRDLEPPEFL